MMIRNRKLIKSISAFFIVLFLSNTFAATVSYALTSGPSQPEYTSFEPMGTTDMVNLSTGDFTYNVPIINIPSPEGGFSMPLSYHGGITMEEEASWVGLGWGLNPGAVNRGLVQYPDDYSGETITTQFKDDGGYGHSINYLLYTRTYDSQVGFGGKVDYLLGSFGVGADWGNQEVLGISFGNGNGVKADAVSVGTRLATAGGMVISFSTGGLGALAVNAISNVAGQAVGATIIGAATAGNFSTSQNDWTINTDKGWFRTDYEYYLDVEKTETMFGSLYLQDPNISITQTKEIDVNGWNGWDDCAENNSDTDYQRYNSSHSSDIYMPTKSSNYGRSLASTNIAYDNYSVMGQHVSGSMRPYRFDQAAALNSSYSETEDDKPDIIHKLPIDGLSWKDYKPQFVFKGELSNNYNYHARELDNLNITTTDITYPRTWKEGVDANGEHECDQVKENGVRKEFSLSSSALSLNNIKPQDDHFINNGSEYKMHRGRDVQWFTNSEIQNDNSNRTELMTPLRTRNSLNYPSKGIGGFRVTSADGVTYHYTIPVYSWDKETYNQKKKYTYNPVTNELTQVNSTDYTQTNAPDRFASTWLLTGITGSDFVDRNGNGTIDEGDWGYWVKFDYGKFSTDYKWRFPFSGYLDAEDSQYEYKISGKRENYYLDKIETRTHVGLFIKEGRKDARGHNFENEALKLNEVIVLAKEAYENSLLTKGSSVASANDKYENVYDIGDIGLDDESELRQYLNEHQFRKTIFNYDYNLCYGVPNSGDVEITTINSDDDISLVKVPNLDAKTFRVVSGIEGVCDLGKLRGRGLLINGEVYFIVKVENRIITLNKSIAFQSLKAKLVGNEIEFTKCGIIAGTEKGKLTLNSVSMLGKNNEKLLPDYIFEYNNQNPDYDQDKQDGWGYFNPNGGRSYSSSNDADVSSWSLSKVITPMGSYVEVNYEQDKYSSESGLELFNGARISKLTTDCDWSNLRIYLPNYFDMTSVPISGTLTMNYSNSSSTEHTILGVDVQNHFVEVKEFPEVLSGFTASTIGNYIYIEVDGYGVDGGEVSSSSFGCTNEFIIGSNEQSSAFVQPEVVLLKIGSSDGEVEDAYMCDGFINSDFNNRCRYVDKIINNYDKKNPISVIFDTPGSRKGGGLRVSSVIIGEEAGQSFETKYVYTLDGELNGLTSGVIGREPDFAKSFHPQYNLFQEYLKTFDPTGSTSLADFKKLFNGQDVTAFRDYFDVANTPVLYGRVGVLDKYNIDGTPYQNKTDYYFRTPHHSKDVIKNLNIPTSEIFDQYGEFGDDGNIKYKRTLFSKVDVNTSRIGRIEHIRVFDGKGTLISKKDFNYKDNIPLNGQGVLTEGSYINEIFNSHVDDTDDSDDDDQEFELHYRLVRTVKKYFPNVLESIDSWQEGVSSTIENNKWDFITGEVLSRKYENSLGVSYVSVSQPAYEIYPEMGPKGLTNTNKHMLSAKAVNYIFKDDVSKTQLVNCTAFEINDTGDYLVTLIGDKVLHPYYNNGYNQEIQISGESQPKLIKGISVDRKSLVIASPGNPINEGNKILYVQERPIVSASVQTWSDDWTYRTYNSQKDNWGNTYGYGSQVWRPKSNYIWNTNINGDGTIRNSEAPESNFKGFNWYSNTQDDKWQKINEIDFYNHFSIPLEQKDIQGFYSSRKLDNNNRFIISSVANSDYTSFTHSSFEHLNANSFDGEILNNGSFISDEKSHTGLFSLKTDNSSASYKIFRKPGLIFDRKYKASVWVHNSSISPNMSAYLVNSSGVESSLSSVSTNVLSIGSWNLIELDFDLNALSSTTGGQSYIKIELSSAGVAYFDDFRVRPIDAPISASVYDERLGEVTYTLDNHNMYTRYEYDESGRVTAVYKETPIEYDNDGSVDGEVKLSEYNYHYADN